MKKVLVAFEEAVKARTIDKAEEVILNGYSATLSVYSEMVAGSDMKEVLLQLLRFYSQMANKLDKPQGFTFDQNTKEEIVLQFNRALAVGNINMARIILLDGFGTILSIYEEVSDGEKTEKMLTELLHTYK